MPRPSRRTRWCLILILAAAAALRLWDLSSGDMLGDEVAYGFRAIGLVDSFNDPRVQSTPVDWFDPSPPAWTRLSFHDHPPLVILIQHASIRLFGERLFAVRFPSVISGLGSILLTFLIGRRLFASDGVGLLSGAILALTLNHAFVSRVGLQESIVIFFILASSYCLVRSLGNVRFLYPAAAAAGFGLLAKYSAVVLAPVALAHLLIYRRAYFRSRHLWLALGLVILIVSPIILYNVFLWRAVGHFDLQLSYVAGQHPEVWAHSPGKQIGSVAERLGRFIPSLIAANSWLFLLSTLAAAAFGLAAVRRRSPNALRAELFLALAIASILAFLVLAGPAPRFLTLPTPFFAIASAALLIRARRRLPAAAFAGALALLLGFELAYTVNNQILPYARGPAPWLASPLRYQTYRWGYAELDRWLTDELAGKMPAYTFETKYRFVQNTQEADLARARSLGRTPYPALILYDGNYELAAELWLYDRRLMYHGWPIASFDEYAGSARQPDGTVAIPANFQTVYFILQTNKAPDPAALALTRGVDPLLIPNRRGEAAFLVYRFGNPAAARPEGRGAGIF